MARLPLVKDLSKGQNGQEKSGVGTTSPLAGHLVWVEGRNAFNSKAIYTS